MNDQDFVNEYIRVLNETVNEAITKNIVMQAQLSVSKKVADRTSELESRIRELTSVSSDNNALQSQLNALKGQLEGANQQLYNKNSHVETFKRELVDARNVIRSHALEKDSLIAEIESLKQQIEELKSKKKKKEKTLNNVALFEANSDTIAINDTF